MEDPKQAYARLQNTEEFRNFCENNFNAFLSSFALISAIDELETKPWQINFYVPETKKMTSFIMTDPVEVSHEQEILQKGEIQELNLNDLKIDFNQILEKVKAIFEDKKSEEAQTIVIMVQRNEHVVWTITYVTATMKMLSIQLNAKNAEIIDVKQSNFSYKFKKP
ncbi:MAG: hypothetical protein KKA65_01225 [Nanoarchaeota archaeon]|nr:hypothetical protein [Nanoarchaeota archaeon]MBU4241841.1 hypothetical protein [Nanoarchaeota archaeon]MBU4351880.1 hypothetical protein [Nanoarchaeota archaeon]MBU4456101.1 hypothetical protein [Nanoarchaeota archaeon]MCG2719753.1 hypothetical protein [Nanoarchaeota archaeon]